MFTSDDYKNRLHNRNLLALVTLLEYDELGIESRSGGRLTARFGNSLEFR